MSKHFLEKGRMVWLVRLTDYSNNEHRVSLMDIICAGIEDQQDRIEAMDWVVHNTDKCVLVMDELDQLPYTLDDPNESETPSLTKKLPPKVILPKILSGDLLKGANVFVLSHPDGVTTLPPSCRPESAVRLVGFSTENVEKLLTHYFQDEMKAAEFLQDLKMKNISLFQVIHNPVLLQLVASLPEAKRGSFRNTTQLLQLMLAGLSRSKHMSDTRIDEDTMIKLRKLSFEKTVEERAVFSGADFKRHDLDVDLIKKICIVAMDPQVKNSYSLFVGEINYFLVHKSVQVSSFNFIDHL